METFSSNDAGFQYIVDKKGVEEYGLATEKAHRAIALAANDDEFTQVVRQWLHFFRKGHIGFWSNQPLNAFTVPAKTTAPEEQPTDEQVRHKYKDSPAFNMTEAELMAALGPKEDKAAIEGVWRYGDYRLGIVRDPGDSRRLIGFILNADGIYWSPNQIKCIIYEDRKHGFEWADYDMDFYMKDHSHRKTWLQIAGKHIFGTEWGYGIKQNPERELTATEQIVVDCYSSS